MARSTDCNSDVAQLSPPLECVAGGGCGGAGAGTGMLRPAWSTKGCFQRRAVTSMHACTLIRHRLCVSKTTGASTLAFEVMKLVLLAS
eukprot:5338984-Amphidinium_carterae.1